MAHPKLTGRRCECTACGYLFNSDTAFDRHRIGDFAGSGQPNTRRCLTPDELIAAGWSRNEAGAWITMAFLGLTEPHKQGTQSEGATYLAGDLDGL